MQLKRFTFGLLIIFLIAGIPGLYLSAAPFVQGSQNLVAVSASTLSAQPGREASGLSLSGTTNSSSIVPQDSAASLAGWQQVNSNGFGDPLAPEVTALQAFGSYLYAGTHNQIDPEPLYDGAGIFRSPDGVTWTSVTLPGFGNPHDTAPPAILDLAVFKNYLYAGTGRGNAAQIWRSADGLNWGQVVNAGFGDPDIVAFSVLTEDNGWLYVGATKQDNEAQIWRTYSGDGNLSNWTQVAIGTEPAQVTGITAFNIDGGLYAAIQSEAGGPSQIWRSYGGLNWTAVITNGFGISNTILTGGIAQFGNDLYVGGGNASDGALLWRTVDGDSWQQVITPAFGDANNTQIDMVFVFQNNLYVSTRNTATGMEIWRSADGISWEQVNQDGFGDSNNTHSNWANASTNFLGQLYVGTSNVVDGGELWRTIPPFAVSLSPDDAQSASAGQTITYTVQITNTGSLSDTYDLALSGQTWTTLLSTSQVDLLPASSTVFSVTINIPAEALGNETDVVTVTATSQGDITQLDSAVLTTSVVPVYGVVLSADDTKSGSAGGIVTYATAITNTGNTSDTYDLALSGQTWTTLLSTSQVSLMPGVSMVFSVTVDIPAEALGNTADVVTVTATSQGDITQSDSAVLTTSVVPFYGVVLSADDTKSGSAGGTVTFTTTITNTGNMSDTYNLALSGQTWTTLLSTSQMSLVPGESLVFTVTVDIPAEALGNETDVVTVTATSQGDITQLDSAVLTTSVTPFYGVVLSPDETFSGSAGESVTYTITITNTGNMTDIFDLSISGNTWSASLSTSSVSLSPVTAATFSVTVDIPAWVLGTDYDVSTITATSQGNAGQSASTALMTTVDVYYGVVLSPDDAASGPAGGNVAYTLHITNTGNVSDTFDLAITGQSWTTTLSADQVGLGPLTSGIFTVTVAVPPGATAQEVDMVTVWVTSQGDATKSDSAVLTTTSVTVPVYAVALSADGSLSGPAGIPLVHTLVITNTGTTSDTYNLTLSGQTWTTLLSTSQVSLTPSASRDFTVTVDIPAEALGNEADVVTVTATSQADGTKYASSILTSSVTPVYGVVLSPDDTASGPSGAIVTYTLTITNTGNTTDTIDLLTGGNLWNTTLSSQSIDLAAGSHQQVIVTVEIPPAASAWASDQVTIQATSRHDPGKSDTALLTTESLGPQFSLFLPIIMRN